MNFANLHVCDHPLIQHKLTLMRETSCPTGRFRALLREISMLMGYEITRDLPLARRAIETPLCAMDAPDLAGRKVAIVPILRAGLGMVEGLEALMPSARIGHIGLYRDHDSKRPVEYMAKLPSPEDRLFILADPMLATGHSARHALDMLLRHGAAPGRIRVMTLVAAPEGVQVLLDAHPDIRVFTAALDDRLDANAYIVPGLGDAGDRLFGTGRDG